MFNACSRLQVDARPHANGLLGEHVTGQLPVKAKANSAQAASTGCEQSPREGHGAGAMAGVQSTAGVLLPWRQRVPQSHSSPFMSLACVFAQMSWSMLHAKAVSQASQWAPWHGMLHCMTCAAMPAQGLGGARGRQFVMRETSLQFAIRHCVVSIRTPCSPSTQGGQETAQCTVGTHPGPGGQGMVMHGLGASKQAASGGRQVVAS